MIIQPISSARKRPAAAAHHSAHLHECFNNQRCGLCSPAPSSPLHVTMTMAEVRRVQLTTFPCDFSSSPNDDKSKLHSNAAASAPASVALSGTEGKCSEVAESQSTVRCVLKLFESNERAFPEFSYTELVEKHKVGFQMACKTQQH